MNRENTTHFIIRGDFQHGEPSENIRVRDRATLFNLLIGLDGYTVCSGVIDEELNGKDIIAVPLQAEGEMHIGYLTRKRAVLSRLGNRYLTELKKYAQEEIKK